MMVTAMTLKIGITCYPTVGGSGVIATELGKMLADSGHEIHFITSDIPVRLSQLNSHIYYHEVNVNQYPVFKHPPYDLTLASKMAEVAKNEKLDILHVHYAVPHAISAYLAKEMVDQDIKIITTLHGTDITVLGYDPQLAGLIRFGIEKSDVVTAVSKSLTQQTYELIQPHKSITPVYNFIDEHVYYDKHCDSLKNELGIQPDDKVIVHVSNFREVKRVPDVIRSFAGIRRHMSAKLLLIGDGPQSYHIRQLVSELSLDNDVLFLGQQNDVAKILSICDLELLLSEKESFGLVLLEAMSCGVPAIGTKTGGIPEVIEDGQTGFLCDVGDITDVVNKSLYILQDDKRHEAMSQNAVNYVREHFHSQNIMKQYEDIYYEMVDPSISRISCCHQ